MISVSNFFKRIKHINFYILTFSIITSLLNCIGSAYKTSSSSKKYNSKQVFVFSFLIIFTIWFIILLAYYPGIFGYDVGSQINQYKKGFSENQPLIHTLYILFFYKYVNIIFCVIIRYAFPYVVLTFPMIIMTLYDNKSIKS